MNDREHAVFTLARNGFPWGAIERILRELPAIQRAHEAACSWPEPIAAPYVKAGERAWARVLSAHEQAKMYGGANIPGVMVRQDDPRGCAVILYAFHSPDGGLCNEAGRLGAPGFTAAQVARIDEYRVGAL